MRVEAVIELPIPVSDLFEIQKMLENDKIICSAFKPPSFNEYFIGDYIREKELYGTKITALLDRNVFTDIISLARGEEVGPISESKKLTAALMAFLQCSDVLIEPNIALYEYASTASLSTANEELGLFRLADNIHPKTFTDVALDRETFLRKKDINPKVETVQNFGKHLRNWEFNYILILKLALIQHEPIEQRNKMAKFMKWMFEDFYFGAPVTLFSNLYLGPKDNRVKLSGLKSLNRNRALLSLKNATWDLTLLTVWAKNVEKQKETNTIWLLCSRDKALMRIARCLVVSGHSEIFLVEERVKNEFIQNWGNKIGTDLYKLFEDLQRRTDDHSRVANKGLPPEYFEKMRLGFEKELLNLGTHSFSRGQPAGSPLQGQRQKDCGRV